MKFYRYHDYPTLKQSYGINGVDIKIHEYDLLRKTPKGYWIVPSDISSWFGADSEEYKELAKKWIPKYSRKRYAYPTKEEAKTSFIARKKKQISHLTNQLERAKDAYKQITDKECGDLPPILNIRKPFDLEY